jgi:hypothetical protein
MSSGKARAVEPPDSLSAGKLTGNFRKISPNFDFLGRFWEPVAKRIQQLAVQFPAPRKQGIVCPEQGFVRPNREFSGGSGGASSCTAPSRITPRPRLRVGRRTSAIHGVCKTSIMWKPDTTFRGWTGTATNAMPYARRARCSSRPKGRRCRPTLKPSPNHLEQSAIGVLLR